MPRTFFEDEEGRITMPGSKGANLNVVSRPTKEYSIAVTDKQFAREVECF